MSETISIRIPIRIRLTLWYVLLLAITFTAFGVYLILQSQHNLQTALDESLQITVFKTIAALDEEDFVETGQLTFDHVGQTQSNDPDFGMRIISPSGSIWDSYSAAPNVPDWGTSEQGYSTRDPWRIYSQPILNSNDQTIGWVQAAQSLKSVNAAVLSLRNQLLWGLPLVLCLSGLGGYFLAGRALQPIEQITRTAQEITVHDLSRRLQYQGAADEIGRLAQTFDQMLERLQSSFERESRFISDAAHELRTPLTVLKGQIDVTLSRARNSEEHESKLRELSAQVDRLIRLSNALLFLSRSDQNQISFQQAVIDLSELLDVLIEQIQPLADERHLELLAHIPNGFSVRGDGDHLIRLFMNLFENALKYTPVGGKITLDVAKASDEIKIALHNSGPGIPHKHLGHLFERFYRVADDRSSQTGGSGLGLAMAKEIARLHGGNLSVWSEPGQGVTFTVHLPNNK